jgi:biofilm PGA synthesis protein PgaD
MKHPTIYELPERQPRAHRYLGHGITMAAWAFLVYLFVPLLTLLAWAFGIYVFAEEMLEPEVYDYLATLGSYLAVIAGAMLIIVLWSQYNRLRYGWRWRRRWPEPVSRQALAERFGVDEALLARVNASQRMVIHHEPAGGIIEIDLAEPGAAPEEVQVLEPDPKQTMPAYRREALDVEEVRSGTGNGDALEHERQDHGRAQEREEASDVRDRGQDDG